MRGTEWIVSIWKYANYLAVMTYEGVDPKFAGNGGIDCYNFLSLKERALDTSLYAFFLTFLIIPSAKRYVVVPSNLPPCKSDGATKITTTRKILMIVLCIVFGIELGYKLSSKQLIYILNPCHIITMVQIYLLCSEPTRRSLVIFRIHIHWLFGAFLAIIFPVLNVRLLPFEVATYWIQHGLIFLIIPPYLMSCGGPFTPEPLKDFSWPVLALVFFSSHMYFVLQGIGMFTLVNLNSMLCPAVSDPFYGPYYRWFAMAHQTLLVLLFGKIYTWVVQTISKALVSVKVSFKDTNKEQ